MPPLVTRSSATLTPFTPTLIASVRKFRGCWAARGQDHPAWPGHRLAPEMPEPSFRRGRREVSGKAAAPPLGPPRLGL
jgi:hypothetical protein